MWKGAVCLLLGAALGIAVSSIAQDPANQPKGCQQLARACYDELVAEVKNRGSLGLAVLHRESKTGHLYVERIHAQGPGREAGFRVGDEIIGLNGVGFSEAGDYTAARQLIKSTFAGVRPGAPVTCTVLRGATRIELELVPARYEGALLAEYIGFKVMALR